MRIYVRLRGGLGNQMFQYAYAVALRERYADAEIYLDVREYEYYHDRRLEIDKFVLDENTKISHEKKLKYDYLMKAYHIYHGVYEKIRGHYPTGYSKLLCKAGYLFSGTCGLPVFNTSKDWYLYGYFHSTEPIVELQGQLFNSFKANEQQMIGLQYYSEHISSNSIALSIRCGPGVLENNWTLYGPDYYQKAISHICMRHGNDQIVVMSDDINRIISEGWFSALPVNVMYVKSCTPVQQIELMKKCRDFVMSNSTFSWWGAFLGSYTKDSIIVAPHSWQGTPLKHTKLMLDEFVFI